MIDRTEAFPLQGTEPALFGPMPESSYHQARCVSSSVLRAYSTPNTGATDAKRALDGGDDSDSDALRLGSVLHLLLLEPERAGEVLVQDRKPSKAERRRADTFAAFGFGAPKHRLSKAVGVDERIDLDGAVRAALESVRELVDLSVEKWTEHAAFWTEQGVVCKARPDMLLRMKSGVLVVVDAKTTAMPIGMWRHHAMRSGLLLQAAHYCEGILRTVGSDGRKTQPFAYDAQALLERIVWLFLVVERKPPHRTRTLAVRGATLRAAMDIRYELLESLATRIKTNDWADPDEGRILDLCDADEAIDRLRPRSRLTNPVEASDNGE